MGNTSISTLILSLIRHALTFLGGYLVAKGIVDEATMIEITGAVITIIGVVMSFIEKRARAPT